MCFNPDDNVARKLYWLALENLTLIEEQMENLWVEKQDYNDNLYCAVNREMTQWYKLCKSAIDQGTGEDMLCEGWWNRKVSDIQIIKHGHSVTGTLMYKQNQQEWINDQMTFIRYFSHIHNHLKCMKQHGGAKYFKRCHKYWEENDCADTRTGSRTSHQDWDGMMTALGMENITYPTKNGEEILKIWTKTKTGRMYKVFCDITTDCCFNITPYDKIYGKENWEHIWETQNNHMRRHGIDSGIKRYDKQFGTSFTDPCVVTPEHPAVRALHADQRNIVKMMRQKDVPPHIMEAIDTFMAEQVYA